MTDREAGDDDSARDGEARRKWFREEILPLEAKLRAYAQRFAVQGGPDVDDLVQEVFTRVISTTCWWEVRSPAAFAMRILRNIALDDLRRRKIVSIDAVADLDALDSWDNQPSPEVVLASREELRELQSIISSLPPVCRRVFTLRKVYDMSHLEIAARLSISVSTVEKHLVKGLRICSEKLARKEHRMSGKSVVWREKKSI